MLMNESRLLKEKVKRNNFLFRMCDENGYYTKQCIFIFLVHIIKAVRLKSPIEYNKINGRNNSLYS